MIATDRIVDIDADTRVRWLVEFRGRYSGWSDRSGPADFKIETLRVVLCQVQIRAWLNDLVSQDVVSRHNICRNLYCPVKVLSDQLIRCIYPLFKRPWNRILEHANCVDLEELEVRLVDLLTRTLAVCQIIHNGPMVRLWPFVPVEFDLVTSSDRRVCCAGDSAFMADDVRARVCCRVYKTTVAVPRDCPTDPVILLWLTRLNAFITFGLLVVGPITRLFIFGAYETPLICTVSTTP